MRDVVRAVAALSDRHDAMGKVFNVGGMEEISMRALAERAVVLSGSRSEVRLQPYEQAFDSGFEDMSRRVPDVSQIHALLGFRPETPLDDILRDVTASDRRPAESVPVSGRL